MKKIINSTLIGAATVLMLATPALAAENTITRTTWYCYTNNYGAETCTENKTETEKYERVIVRELSAEEAYVINQGVTVAEHQPLDTALTPAQIAPLMGAMVVALAGVAYKFKRNAA